MSVSDAEVRPAIAVSDMDKAKEFYEGKLGLSNGEGRPDGGTSYRLGGGTSLHVYPSPDNAGKSSATLAAFVVDDVEGTVGDLAANGVSPEQYDADPIRTNEKGIAELGGDRAAWVKDPDGNILAITEES